VPTTDAIRALRFEEQDLSAGDLELEAEANESYRVMDLGIDGANDDTMVEVSIGEESMLTFPAHDGDDTLFREISLQAFGQTLYGYMREEGLPAPMLQVPEGDTFSISSDTGSGTATIIYREGDATLASPTAPGGPGTKQRMYPVSGTGVESSAAASTQTTIEIETSRQPAQYDDFPFGTEVPSNREYDLLALMVRLEDAAGEGGTVDSIRLTTEEQRFLENDAGFVDAANAEYPALDPREGPLVFPQGSPGPQTFEPGDELDLEVQATNGNVQGDLRVNATFLFERRAV